MGFVAFQVINIIACFGACFGHILANPSKALLVLNAISVGVMVITVFEEFIQFLDISGVLDGVGFVISLNGANWCLLSPHPRDAGCL